MRMGAVQRAVATSMAQNKLATECGFDGIVPRMWIGPVNAMTPDGRDFVSWDALWMEEAEGISLDMLTFGVGKSIRDKQMQLVDRNLVKDLLFSKCAQLVVNCSAFLCIAVAAAESCHAVSHACASAATPSLPSLAPVHNHSMLGRMILNTSWCAQNSRGRGQARRYLGPAHDAV